MASQTPTPTQAPINLNKVIALALAATVSGGGWGTLTVQSAVEEVRSLRADFAKIQLQQSEHRSATARDIAVLKAEVTAMRRELDQLRAMNRSQ